MSSGRVTDQKPFSCGNSLISEVQCTGQLARSSLNSSCGGPSSHRSRSRTRTSFREEAGWAAIPARYRKLDTLSGAPPAAESDADHRQPAAQLAARQRALLADRAAQQLGVVRPAVGRGRQDDLVDRRRELVHRPADRVAVAVEHRIAEEAHAEGDVAMLVAGDVGEAGDEGGK